MSKYLNMRVHSASEYSGRYDKLFPISKALARVLRHTGVHTMQSDGYASLDVVLNLPQLRLLGATEQDIRRIVQGAGGNTKKRFDLGLLRNGVTQAIRAAQGHSRDSGVVREDAWPRVKMVGKLLHGTTWDAAQCIVRTGIYRQNRLHIHFVEYDKAVSMDVVSGVRHDSELGILVDGERAQADGIVFYRSSNGVILSAGIHGLIHHKYILRIIDLANNDTVYTPGDGWCKDATRGFRKSIVDNCDGTVKRRHVEDDRRDHNTSERVSPDRSKRSKVENGSADDASPDGGRMDFENNFDASPERNERRYLEDICFAKRSSVTSSVSSHWMKHGRLEIACRSKPSSITSGLISDKTRCSNVDERNVRVDVKAKAKAPPPPLVVQRYVSTTKKSEKAKVRSQLMQARPKPALTRPKPVLTRPKQALARPKLVLTRPKPALTRPKPVLTIPKLVLARPTLVLARPTLVPIRPKLVPCYIGHGHTREKLWPLCDSRRNKRSVLTR
eukprot:GEMP01021257.1.p1 GENE.GEMP01021257.1~~GEMP01021257.1.p1  ORF type:complete len:501 (+),score=96.55 GEMP01021257.1:135-1637(+)